MFNKMEDLNLLSKKEGSFIDIHQLAPEFSFTSPADFTLETSRPGGAALAALASLHTLGTKGYQRNLANLVRLSLLTKKLLRSYEDVMVCNKDSLGYVTMFRLYPPELKNSPKRFLEFTKINEDMKIFIDTVNKYTKEFFSWDYKNRMLNNIGVEYSFSSG
jgi:glutamate/tyrosine decarboxylase-like PLP-dependent enzyme